MNKKWIITEYILIILLLILLGIYMNAAIALINIVA